MLSSLTSSAQIKCAAAESKLPSQPGAGEEAESLRDEQLGCPQEDPRHGLSTSSVPGACWGCRVTNTGTCLVLEKSWGWWSGPLPFPRDLGGGAPLPEEEASPERGQLPSAPC